MTTTTESLEERYRAGAPRSEELFERGRPLMAGVAKGAYFHKPFPLTIERGEGCYLYDVDGRKFVDFGNHHTAQILGHCHPAVDRAVQEQLARGIALGAPVGTEADLAQEMLDRVPSLERIRFCNSGTEATLHAIRLARGFSGRPKIAKLEGGYHGSHDVVEVSVSPPLDKAGPETAPCSVPTTGGISAHAAEEVVVLPYDDEASVEEIVADNREELACVIFDPKAGILPQRKEFVQSVREITRNNEVLLILDEIVGFRIGRGGMQEHFGIAPDLTTYGKLIGGGFPAGAFGGRADIMDLLDNTRGSTGFSQSGTFSAHPIAMAAGLATLKELTPDAFAHLNMLGGRLVDGLSALFERENLPAHVVCTGSAFGIHFSEIPVTNYRALAQTDKVLPFRLFLSLVEQSYLLSPALLMNALSLPMEAGHVDGLIHAFGDAVKQVR